MARDDLRSAGDRDLSERLTRHPTVQAAMNSPEAARAGARRELLATSLRLTRKMAPDIAQLIDACRARLQIATPTEVFVYASATFNAACVRPEGGRVFMMLSSALVEAFDADELAFVVGHELGHHLFDHHRIPVGLLLRGAARGEPGLVLQLYAWQRYAELSADRAGLVCAGGVHAAARALFKVTSGLRGERVRIDIEAFLDQAGDLAREIHTPSDDPERSEWFTTHPFSPLRLHALQRVAASELLVPGGTPRARLEEETAELMALMEPGYVHEKSEAAEALRRLFFAGGVALAAVSGGVTPAEVRALEQFLGEGSLPEPLDVEAIGGVLGQRVAAARELATPLRRGQVLRDLCVVALADGRVDIAEQAFLERLATELQLDPGLVARTIATGGQPLD